MSQIAPVLIKKDADKPTTWRYALSDKRDLRIDFMRGIALVMMVVAHTEVMSIFNIFTWKDLVWSLVPRVLSSFPDLCWEC